MIRLLSSIIVLQLVFVFQIQNVHAGVEKTFQKKANKMVTGLACDSTEGFGCTVLDTAVDDPELLNEVVNMILLFTMTLTLIDSKCEVTKSGKELKPKSYTAGITHWIHKLAALIYIYAEIQNVITLRKLDKEYSDSAKVEGQLPKLLALQKVYQAKQDAAKKKLKVLKLSNMGFGASAAIDIGMSAAFGIWSGYKQGAEATMCLKSQVDLASCPVIGTSAANSTTTGAALVGEATNKCMAKFQTIASAQTLISTAKSTVTNTVVKGVSSAVGGIIGKKITEKAGGGKAAQIAGAGTGVFIGKKVGAKVADAIAENIEFLKTDPGSSLQEIVKSEPRKCITEGVNEVAETTAKNVAASVFVDTCAASTLGTACPAAISASCALKSFLQKENCVCMVRNTAKVAPALKKMVANLSLTSDLLEDEKLLDTMATDAGADDLLAEVSGAWNSDYMDIDLELDADKDLTNDQINEKWAVDDQKSADARENLRKDNTCGIDYTNWIIRHDLECSSAFDFLNEDEIKEAPPVSASINKHMQLFKSESMKFEELLAKDWSEALNNNSPEERSEVVKLMFNNSKLSVEYDSLDLDGKMQVEDVLRLLADAMKSLKSNLLISSAYAEELTAEEKEKQVDDALKSEKDFTSTTNEVTAFTGLGLGVVGMFLFPKFIKKGMKLTTVLQRNPMRRGIYYLASYFMAKINLDTTKKKISRIGDNLKVVEKMIEEESGGQTSMGIPFKKKFFYKFSPIQSAHANVVANNLQPLCMKGAKFDLTCECLKTNSCGNRITQFSPLRTEIFEGDPAFLNFTRAQMSFVKKMSVGKVREQDYTSLENTLRSLSPKLDPIVAANNLDANFKLHNMPELNMIKHSKRLVASLQNNAFEELKKFKGAKIDLSKLKKSDVYDSLDTVGKEKGSPEIAEKPSVGQNIEKFTRANTIQGSATKEQSLADYKVDMSDINENKDLDLFKIIKNRYHKIFFTK